MQFINEQTVQSAPKPHKLVLDDRHLLTVSGIVDVDNFDETKIEARTEMGGLIIEGEGLHIVRLMLENGELIVEGSIGGVAYVENRGATAERGGFLSRLLR
ncbi:MAG: sporulation protein YabP [Clostridia bacterium]|nr:sporulation protein YabP [Clostridia bacterium]